MNRTSKTTFISCYAKLCDACIGIRAAWRAWHHLQRRQARPGDPRQLFETHFAQQQRSSELPGRPQAATVDVEKTMSRSSSVFADATAQVVVKLAIVAMAAAFAGSCADANEVGSLAAVRTMPSEERPATRIEDATAWLRVDADGVTMTMATSDLVPGHVTTAWWVIVMAPNKCLANPCAPKEIIERATEIATQISYADGALNGPDGTARFAAYLPKGQVAGGWFQTVFEQPLKAEIHLVLNDHGPLVPELAATMLTTYRGGCRDESLPPPFPASAKADGLPGPNACQLIQAAIFLPGGRPAYPH